MKKLLFAVSILVSITAFAQIEGTWRISNEFGSLMVGPSVGSGQYYSYPGDGSRPCLLDDSFTFNNDGSFAMNVQNETWLETGAHGVTTEGCGATIAPFDGSSLATWKYDAGAKTLTVVGKGAYLGLNKAYNGGELVNWAPVQDSIVYQVTDLSDEKMTLDIAVGGGNWWRFILAKEGVVQSTSNTVEFSASDAWVGYANIFDFAGAYQFGNAWAIDELKTTIDVTGNSITLQPNFNLFGDGTDEYWAKDGKGQKNVEANTEVETDGSFNGKDLTFRGSVLSNTLDTSYDAYFHIVALDPNNGYQDALGGAGRTKLPSSGNFSVTISGDDLAAGLVVKYGFRIFGVNANPADETALGSVVIGETQPELAGRWKLAPRGGSMGVGPNQGDISWWNNSQEDVETRHCLFADHYVFNIDGSFENDLAEHTWLETWQAAEEGCGEPVAPHDGSASATWSYDAPTKSITLVGKGAYLGLSKVTNTTQLEDPANAPDTITYLVTDFSDSTLMLDINYGNGGEGWWRFNFVRTDETMSIDSLAKDTGDTSGFIIDPKWGATSIYPNPTNEFVNIQSNERFTSYLIYDQLGQTIQKGEIVANRIPVADLRRGVYFIAIINEENLGFVRKLIKN